MEAKKLVAFNIVVFSMIFIGLGLFSCSKPVPEFKASYHMLWQSTEILDAHETVKIYYDVLNENMCYLYYYDDERVARVMTCIRQPRLTGF